MSDSARTPDRGEFEIIAAYFAALGAPRADVHLGVGDDAALVDRPPGTLLTRTSSVRPRPGETPAAFARRALVPPVDALLDAGARPAWATLALTLARPDTVALAAFSAALDVLARDRDIAIVGGDTTRGPTRVTVTVVGNVP